MTCIVGLKNKGKVYIGADSLGSNGVTGTVNNTKKLFHIEKKDDIILGYTTSFRMGQLLQYSNNLIDELLYSKNSIDERYVITKLIPKLQSLFSEGGFEKISEGVKSGGNFLIGIKDKLYKVQDDYSVLESIDDYVSCGCGEELALGSLFTTENMNLDPEYRIKLALESASKFSVGVSHPFYIVDTESSETRELK